MTRVARRRGRPARARVGARPRRTRAPAAPASLTIDDGDRDSLVYVAGGSGALELDGVSYPLAAEVAALVLAGERATVTRGHRRPRARARQPSGPTSTGTPRWASAAVVVAVDHSETSGATGKRSFQVLFGPHNGSTRATLFAGFVPPGRAPWHYHLYDEIVWVPHGPGPAAPRERRRGAWPGRGVPAARARGSHRGEHRRAESWPSSALFTPAGSPSAAYLPPAARRAIVGRPRRRGDTNGRRLALESVRVTTTSDRATWVGRSVLRVEDEALLRGAGRFLDDLSPAPHACHAAVVRSQLPHARIRSTRRAALEAPGVVGVLTGEDVKALSRPFPAGIDSPMPHYAAAVETARYVGEPLAVVVARDRYAAEDAAELVAVDYEQLDAVLDAGAAAETESCVHDRTFHYGDVDEALASAALVVRETFRFPRFTCTPVECYAVVADWSEAERLAHRVGQLPGPVLPARCRRCGARATRQPAPPSDAPRLRWLVRDQVVGARLRGADGARQPQARRPGALDGGPRRAPARQRRRHRSRDDGRGGLHRGR